MRTPFAIGTRVKSPVWDRRRGRWFLHGTVVGHTRVATRTYVGVDTGGTLCWYPVAELLEA